MLGKIKQLEQAGNAQLIIADAPASGHAMSFLRAARGLQSAIETGPIRRQANDVVDLVTDPQRAQALLVTLAEETTVNALIETAYALEDEVDIQLGPTVVNAVFEQRQLSARPSRSKLLDPALAHKATAAGSYWASRSDTLLAQMHRLAADMTIDISVVGALAERRFSFFDALGHRNNPVESGGVQQPNQVWTAA